MTVYDDDAIALDENGVTIKHFYRPGSTRHIPYAEIVRADPIALRFGTGRYRLVGISPARPRHFFHWQTKRIAKHEGVSLDVGRWWRLGITPDDPEVVLKHLHDRIGKV